MKRIFAYITMLTLAVACESMYGPEETQLAPDTAAGIEIAVSEVKDNGFTVTVTPSGEAAYYSWLVDEAKAPEKLDSTVLYEVGYESVTQGTAKWTAEATSTTFKVEGLKPNTTYQIYAVAGSKMGFAGSVAVKDVKTTDTVAPKYASYDTEGHQVLFTFSENVARDASAGAIKVPYFAYYTADFDADPKPVGEITVPEDSIAVAGDMVLISVPDLPTGALWTISIPEGAFVDAVGQKLPAYSSTFVSEEDEDGEPYASPTGFVGEVDYVELPMLGELEVTAFTEWDGGFVIPLENDYPIAGFSSKNFITVTYEVEVESSVETIVYTLAPEDDYNITSQGLEVNLPAEPMALGADVIISVPAAAFYDIYGNDCEKWEHTMKYSYGYDLDDIVGTYDMLQLSALTEGISATELVIAESDDKKKGNVMITSYLDFDCSIYADFDVDAGTLSISSPQILGSIKDSEGTVYPVVICSSVIKDGYITYNLGEDPIVFSVPEANCIEGPDWYYSIFILDPDGKEAIDYFDVYALAIAELASEEETPAPASLNSKLAPMSLKRF